MGTKQVSVCQIWHLNARCYQNTVNNGRYNVFKNNNLIPNPAS